MADPLDATPWTIKNFPVETRQKIMKAAHAADQTAAQWMVDAANRWADQQAGNLVIPPGKPERQSLPLPDLDLHGLASALTATIAALQASGEQPPKSLGKGAAATLNRYMRTARGLPETRGKTIRQTTPLNRANLQILTGNFEEVG